MGKKTKGDAGSNNAAQAQMRKGPEGGILFSSNDALLESVRKQVKLNHITKPWTREAWERARPWVLEQRQKMEAAGWAGVDALRTELFVLRRSAPHADTEDGFLYVRIPKKFIDFNRSGAKDDGAADEATEGDKKTTKRVSKRKENAPSYELNNPDVWRIRIDGDLETSDVEPNVQLDVAEPFENIFYLIQTLQPGLARITASRKDVIQQGTRESDTRDDGEGGQTIRHRAEIAAHESYMRVLPPAFWFRRNETELRKILQDETFDATLAAAEDKTRSVERTIKDVQSKTWEEKVQLDEHGNPSGPGIARKANRPPRLSAIAAASCLGTAAA